jgi:hypothetical protein
MEAQFRSFSARSDVVRAAECREKIIQRHFVGQIDDRKAEVSLVAVSVEEVVLAHCKVKEAARLDALWIVIVILDPRC